VLTIYLCKLEALKALLAWLKKNEGVLEHYDHGVRRRAQTSAFSRQLHAAVASSADDHLTQGRKLTSKHVINRIGFNWRNTT